MKMFYQLPVLYKQLMNQFSQAVAFAIDNLPSNFCKGKLRNCSELLPPFFFQAIEMSRNVHLGDVSKTPIINTGKFYNFYCMVFENTKINANLYFSNLAADRLYLH